MRSSTGWGIHECVKISWGPDAPEAALDPAVRLSQPPEIIAAPASTRRPASNADGRVKLLLAEDERLSREHLEETLTSWGYDVTATHDGAKALAMLLKPDAPRLAMLDWEMPGLSGIEVCRVLRSRVDDPYVYVLLCTGRDGQQHLINGLTAGADDYVRKPIDLQELEVRIRAGRRVVLLQDRLLEAQVELERRALYDSLTGAKNRGAIADVLRRELSRSQRTHRPVSVILSDVDHFKQVNDVHGHPAGDAVLVEFVERMKGIVRIHDDIGRWGGEEFLAVLPECPADDAMGVAERLRSSLSGRSVEAARTMLSVTASFGVAGTDQGYEDVVTIIAAADAALYAAKAAGRNRTEKAESSGPVFGKRTVA